jgi:aminoglycoside phosphotransferase family enzyme
MKYFYAVLIVSDETHCGSVVARFHSKQERDLWASRNKAYSVKATIAKNWFKYSSFPVKEIFYPAGYC